MEGSRPRSRRCAGPTPATGRLITLGSGELFKEKRIRELFEEKQISKFFLERSELLEIVFVSTLYYVDILQAVEESIFDEVIRLARSMVVDDGNNVVHRQVLPMTVEIVISENEEEMSARTLRNSRVDEAFPALPEMHHEAVGEWAISQVTGGLEKVALESCSVKPRCAICLDTILVGNRMPCSHIYHGHCIYRWLRKSSLCPLCHFAMPCNLLG